MNPNREEALFQLALEKPAEKRAAFLDVVCEGDVALRARLDALLAAHEQPDTLLAPQAEAARSTIRLDLADAPDEAVGQKIGRYKILEKVGEGGCGVVYVAEQTEPVRRRVALKVIKMGMDTKQVVARFEAERQALAMMDHPNIAKVLDAGTTETGRPYFVMELVRGIKITEYCDQEKISTRDRLDLFIKVCQAIQHAHQKGIIHRDIKPSNILVTLHDGVPVPKVIDFGIAKATEGRLTDNTVYTQLHQFIGTPAYMSPEQAEMSGLDIDTRSDIYSLGVLLYELLAGSTPFDAKELMASGIDAMRKTIREKEPQRPSTRLATLGADQLTTTAKRRSADTSKLLHQLKGDLDWIVMKCLEKDRTRRYESASGLATDLKRHLNNETVTARPPSTAYRFQKAFRRNKLAFTAAAAVSLALILGVAVSTWQMLAARRAQRDTELARSGEQQERLTAQAAQRTAEDSARLAARRLYAADMNLAQQAFTEYNWGRAAELLNRHRPAAGEGDLRGWEWRYLWQRIQAGAHDALPEFDHTLNSVSYSPDGRFLAVGFHKDGAELWDVKLKRRVKVLAPPGRTTRCVYDPTGARLAVYREDGNSAADRDAIVLWNAGTHEVEAALPAPDGFAPSYDVRHLAFSRNGRMVAAYFQGYTNEVRGKCYVAVWDVATRRALWTVRAVKEDAAYSGLVGAVCFGPGDKTLLAGDIDGRIYSFDVLDGRLIQDWQAYENRRDEQFARGSGLACLALSPDGRVLASGAAYRDAEVKLWDPETGGPIGLLTGHQSWVSSLQFSADGRTLYSAGGDTTWRAWDVESKTLQSVRGGHWGVIDSLSLSEDGNQLATACEDGNLFIWSTRAAGAGLDFLLRHLPKPKVGLSEMMSGAAPWGELYTCSPDGRTLFTYSEKGAVERWDPDTLETLGEVAAFGQLPRLIFIDGSDRIVVGHESNSQVFRLEPLALERTLDGFLAESASRDGRYLRGKLVATGETRILDAQTWKPTATVALTSLEHLGDPRSFVTTLFGDSAASAQAECLGLGLIARRGERGSLTVLNLLQSSTPVVVTNFVDHGRRPIRRMAFSPDGQWLATCSDSGETHVWRTKDWTRVANIRGRGAPIDLAFSQDSHRLITTGGEQDAITLWDTATWQELITLDAPGAVKVGLPQLLQDGRTLIAASYDHGRFRLRVWHVPTWEEIAAIEAKGKAESR